MVKRTKEKINDSGSAYKSILQWLGSPLVGAMIGSIGGVGLASYNSNLSEYRFFLEKRAIVADNIATEFSRYIVNYNRLINLHKLFNEKKSKHEAPTESERENFFKVRDNRDSARVSLFAHLDSARLYYSDETSILIEDYQKWDDDQSTRTVDHMPTINEWRNWQNKILKKLHKEISNDN